MAPRRQVRSRLAGWLRRLSLRVARTAAVLERPAPDTVALDGSGAADGPPEHWLRMVAERAPELLDGRGIRVGTTLPHLPDSVPPMPDMARAEVSTDGWAAGSPVHRSADWGSAVPVPRPASAPDEPAPARPTRRPARAAVEATPAEHARRPGLNGRPLPTVDRPERRTVESGTPHPALPRRVLERLVSSWTDRRRSPVETGSPVPPPRAAGPVEPSPAVVPFPSAPVVPTPPRMFGWSVDDIDRHPAPGPVDRAAVGPAQPELWGRFPPVPLRRNGDWRSGPPARERSAPAPRGPDTRWPAAPSDGPWQWTSSLPTDRWPALPDDSSLWTPPVSAFTDAQIRRLDDEQRGV